MRRRQNVSRSGPGPPTAENLPVRSMTVVGLPHERWSEAITAVVVSKPGETIDPAALISALKERLDGCQVPKSVIVADELPRTSTGKVQKNVVRDRHAAHYGWTG